jgi:hypothetical protein
MVTKQVTGIVILSTRYRTKARKKKTKKQINKTKNKKQHKRDKKELNTDHKRGDEPMCPRWVSSSCFY